ncbi:mechanosensitive ion channel family protein [Sneathiella sp.]|uniref:mechanosensitive ion channel family protein n=1 Tax=Sneathiella sp. TaxID=1964365 RepID=UPI003564A5F7
MQNIQDFWNIVREVWHTGYMGIDFSSIITALLILAFALLIRGVFTRFVVNRVVKLAQRSKSQIDDQVILALKCPIRFIPVVLGIYFALEIPGFEQEGNIAIASGRIIRSLIVFNLFWALYCAIDPLTYFLGRLEELFSVEMVRFLVKIMKGIVAGLGAATVLELWGIQVGPIIAGLGIVGVAVALGAQDLFKNLISGFLILAEKRFKAGDWVKVDDIVEGTVEKIGFRSTMIRRFDKAPTIVPNATFADKAVTNFSEMTHRRIFWKIGVEYSTTVAQLQTITGEIKDYLIGNEDFVQPEDATMFVVTDSFNQSSIDIMIYCFTKTTVWGDWLDIKQDFAYAIKRIVENAGTGFAFPSLSVYPGEGAETPDPYEPPPDFKQGHTAQGSTPIGDEGR